MQPSLFDDKLLIGEIAEHDVASALSSGAMLLTATSIHAIDWKRRVISASDSPVTETPEVIDWQAWLTMLVIQNSDWPLPLSRLQELQLWEQVIRKDLSDGSQSASSIRGLARHAQEAWSVMQEYRIPLSELAGAGEEAEALACWCREIKRLLSQEPLEERMLAADKTELLLSNSTPLTACSTILLDGFETFTPVQQQLLQSLQQQGVALLRVTNGINTNPELSVVRCSDEAEEFHYLADRIAAILAESPQARIALLTSDAISDLAPLRRQLNFTLIPESRYDPVRCREAVDCPAIPLGEAVMIQQLLFLLGLAGKRSFVFSDFSRLLMIPWLNGFETERYKRAELDRLFRQQNRHHISLATLLDSTQLQGLPDVAALLRSLSAWKQSRASASQWVKRIDQLLQTIGFTPSGFGESTRSNHEIRLLNSFRDQLGSLVSLDEVTGSISWSRFLSILRSACMSARMPREVSFSNVSLLPLQQAVGMRFDYLLLAGFEAQAFPLAAHSVPLLPPALQQKYRIDMSNASMAFDSSAYIWQQLTCTAPRIEISFVQQRGEQEVRPSSLIHGIDYADFNRPGSEQCTALELEPYDDTQAMPLQVAEAPRGGTAILRDQSACPFRAFARYRLHIRELGDSAPGIEPTTKGSLLHLALEYIWQRLQTAERLHGLDEADQLVLVNEAIDHACLQIRALLPESLKGIEVQRMQGLLLAWLEVERARPPFQVLAIEKGFDLRLPHDGERQLAVHIKADRIDRDAEGRQIVIDYKSGAKQSVSRWIGERIEEPQLPLYAIAAGVGAEDAVSFARIRSGEMGFEGLAAEDVGIKGITACDGKRGNPESWEELLQAWQQQLDSLAEEFVDGRCEVTPRDERACQYCGLEAVCRIEESGFDSDAGDAL